MRIDECGEQGLIRRIARKIRTDSSVIQGIGDDCAVLKGSGGRILLFASDMLVEGVHFLPTADPAGVGWKALAVNVSDIAAMGGVPRHAVISLGLPRKTTVAFVDGLYQGLTVCAKRFGVNLVGGDTDRAGQVVVDVAILGEVEKDRLVFRSGSKVGDHLLVTGRLGGSVRSGRHLKFTPRLREARSIGAIVRPHAMIDLSDGLGPDLLRLCEQSRVAAELEAARIPRRRGSTLAQALTEGEDFELLMAVGRSDADRLLSWGRRHLPCGLRRIGRVVRKEKGPRVRVLNSDGRPIPISLEGFHHF